MNLAGVGGALIGLLFGALAACGGALTAQDNSELSAYETAQMACLESADVDACRGRVKAAWRQKWGGSDGGGQ